MLHRTKNVYSPEVAVPDISGEETVAADVPRIVSLKEAPAAESEIPASVSIPEPEIKELEAAAEVEEVLKPSIPEPGEVEIVLKPAEPKPPKPPEKVMIKSSGRIRKVILRS